MSLGIVVDVMIGLAFTYLMLAVMASGIQEMVAGLFDWRAKDLRKGLKAMLDGTAQNSHLMIGLFGSVFGHSLISGLSKTKLPSYVPSRNFALSLFEALKGSSSGGTFFNKVQQGVAALPTSPAKEVLSAFISETAGDVDALQKRVETWFDDAMDRVSGDYRRYSQWFAAGFGLFVAVTLNVDSISLARSLWTDPVLRNSVVAAAQRYVDENKENPAPSVELGVLRCQLIEMKLPIGWSDTDANLKRCEVEAAEKRRRFEELKKCEAAEIEATKDKAPEKVAPAAAARKVCEAAAIKAVEGAAVSRKADPNEKIENRSALEMFKKKLFEDDGGLWVFVGWLITAAAVSFGSTFWFGALKQLFSMRNAGPRPPRADDPSKEKR